MEMIQKKEQKNSQYPPADGLGVFDVEYHSRANTYTHAEVGEEKVKRVDKKKRSWWEARMSILHGVKVTSSLGLIRITLHVPPSEIRVGETSLQWELLPSFTYNIAPKLDATQIFISEGAAAAVIPTWHLSLHDLRAVGFCKFSAGAQALAGRHQGREKCAEICVGQR